jgi:hypothetical protein
MMYRVLPFLLVALAVAAFAAAPICAAEDETHEAIFVKAADGKITCADKEGKEHIATVAKDAKITCDGKECKLEDLKKDVKLKITVTKDGDKVTVTKIEATTK